MPLATDVCWSVTLFPADALPLAPTERRVSRHLEYDRWGRVGGSFGMGPGGIDRDLSVGARPAR